METSPTGSILSLIIIIILSPKSEDIGAGSESPTKIGVGATCNFQPTPVRGVHPGPWAIGRPVSGDLVLFNNWSRLSIYYMCSEEW